MDSGLLLVCVYISALALLRIDRSVFHTSWARGQLQRLEEVRVLLPFPTTFGLTGNELLDLTRPLF